MNFWKIADVWHELMTGVLGHRKYAAAGCDVGALVHLAAHVLDPATLGYGLTDSPAGMLAWILKRWAAWSDDHGDIESVFTKDDLLTHATIFWAGDAIASSIRTYANNNRYPWRPSHDRRPVVRRPPASPSSATRTRPAGRALPEQ
jgi:hypothetical protein